MRHHSIASEPASIWAGSFFLKSVGKLLRLQRLRPLKALLLLRWSAPGVTPQTMLPEMWQMMASPRQEAFSLRNDYRIR